MEWAMDAPEKVKVDDRLPLDVDEGVLESTKDILALAYDGKSAVVWAGDISDYRKTHRMCGSRWSIVLWMLRVEKRVLYESLGERETE
jgi:hypothetical protein